MNKTADIRDLYTPIQPTALLSDANVVYTERFPDIRLQHFIYCYWQFKTTRPLVEKFNHLIVADGCIDIFFELNKPEESYVMGFCKEFTTFQLDHSFNYVGVRFLPTMFPQLFNVNAKDLSNKSEHLYDVDPATGNFIRNHLNDSMDFETVKTILDRYFLQVISKMTFNNDNRLYEAIDTILRNPGGINIKEDLETGISSRQLRRLFEFYIGDNIKTFSKVVRFQHVLRAKPSSQSLREDKLFFDAGYYDQPHFIKEFKSLYGITPGKAFGK